VSKEATGSAAPALGNCAKFTPLLRNADFDPDVLVLTANIGVGDSFPVQLEGKPKVFDVTMKEASSNRLLRDRSGNVTHIHIAKRKPAPGLALSKSGNRDIRGHLIASSPQWSRSWLLAVDLKVDSVGGNHLRN
jgi:hypothetical protein